MTPLMFVLKRLSSVHYFISTNWNNTWPCFGYVGGELGPRYPSASTRCNRTHTHRMKMEEDAARLSVRTTRSLN